jgi:hypothetical protein
MKLSPLALLLSASALVIAGALGTAQIERLDLGQMVSKTDGEIFGTIVGKEVIRIDHPVDGPELYFTMLTIEGTSLRTNQSVTKTVTFAGGFLPNGQGVFNSEAPSADDVAIGNKVVAFYKWTDNMGGDLAANALYAAHGGLYRTFTARQGVVVQGRGESYAIPSNRTIAELRTQINQVPK